MGKKLRNGKFSKNGLSETGNWASVEPNRALKPSCVRDFIDLNEPVLIVKIFPCNEFSDGEYLARIVCNQESREIPLSALCLSPEQKKKLVDKKIVRKSYFSLHHQDCLEGAYIKPQDGSLLHPEEEQF